MHIPLRIIALVLLVVATWGCRLTDNTIRGSMGSNPSGIGGPPAVPPVLSAKPAQWGAPIPEIDLNVGIVTINDLPSGLDYAVDFDLNGVDVSTLSCDSKPFLKITGNSLRMVLGARSADGVEQFSCNFDGLNLQVVVNYKAGSEFFFPLASVRSSQNKMPISAGSNVQWVVFQSTGLHVMGFKQLVAKNLLTGEEFLLSSLDKSDFNAGQGDSSDANVMKGGTKVVFLSAASNFPGANGKKQIYLKDLNSPENPPILISTSDGTTPADSDCSAPRINETTNKVAFNTMATNFPGSSGWNLLYLKNLQNLSAAPEIVSTTNGVTVADAFVGSSQISLDGSTIYFSTAAPNYPGANTKTQIYSKDLTNLTLAPQHISTIDGTNGIDDIGILTILSDTQNKVVFYSKATNLIGYNNKYQVYAKDLGDLNQAPVLVSSTDGATVGDNNVFTVAVGGASENLILVSTLSSNFPGSNGVTQIYMKDLNNLSAAPVLISQNEQSLSGDRSSSTGTFVLDSQKIVFETLSLNFVDNVSGSTIVMKDLTNLTSALTRVSPEGGGTAAVINSPQIYGDLVTFASSDSSLPGYNGWSQIYLVDLSNIFAPPKLVSSPDGVTPGDESSVQPVFSPDGTKIAFESDADNLVGNPNSTENIYVKDITDLSSTPILVSSQDGINPVFVAQDPAWVNNTEIAFASQAYSGNGFSGIAIKDFSNIAGLPIYVSSDDGTSAQSADNWNFFFSWGVSPNKNWAAFESQNTNLANATGTRNIWVKDLNNIGTSLALASGTNATTAANALCWGATVNDAGQVVFMTYATNFPNSDGTQQIFMKDATNLSAAPVLVSTFDGTNPTGENSYLMALRGSNAYFTVSSTKEVFVKDINAVGTAAASFGFGYNELNFTSDGKKAVTRSNYAGIIGGNSSAHQLLIIQLP